MRMLSAILPFLSLVLVLLFLPLPARALGEPILLEWRDTVYFIVPGHCYSISLHMEFSRYPTCGGCAARAGIEAGPLRVMLEPSGWIVWYDAVLRIYVSGELVQEYNLGSMPCGPGAFDARLTIDCDSAGNCVVYYSGQRAAQFSIDGPEIVAVFEEECSLPLLPTARSSVDIRTIDVPTTNGNNNGSSTTTTIVVNPPPPDYTPGSNPVESVTSSIIGTVNAAIALFFIGLALIGVLVVYRQAKKHRLLALVPLVLFSSLFPSLVLPAQADVRLVPLSSFPVEKWKNGVVVIVCGSAYGTAEWISDEYVLTAAHIPLGSGIGIGGRCTVVKGYAESPAVLVALSEGYDVAVFRVEHPEVFEAKHIFRIRVDPPEIDEEAYVIGYPAELYEITGSLREMSLNPRIYWFKVPWYDQERGIFEIGYTDQGNSGGPIVDIDGNIIGIVSFALRRGVAYLFYGTSSDAIVGFLEQAGIPFTPATRQLAVREEADNTFWAGFLGGLAGGLLVDIVLVAAAAAVGAYVAARRGRG